MANFKQAFGGDSAFTLTLASLANAAARESTAIDNSSNLYVDALLRLQIKLATGTPASDKLINIYAYGSEDGSNYGDNATGTDAAVTLRSPTNLRLVYTLYTPDAGALTYKTQPFGIAWAFGGILPVKWGIVVENRTNLAFDSTEGNHAKAFNGAYYTVS
jgi:hypothetical protein